MNFEWDEKKNKSNREKHGIWFEEASSVFQDDHARVFLDEGHSSFEERFIIVGKSSASRVLIVVHCYREKDQIIRIISARKASRSERGVYEEGI